jgi:hypothetical protein
MPVPSDSIPPTVIRTYGGRNSQNQIQQDSQDLNIAQERDLQAIRDALINEGNSPNNVDAAFDRLRNLNTNR